MYFQPIWKCWWGIHFGFLHGNTQELYTYVYIYIYKRKSSESYDALVNIKHVLEMLVFYTSNDSMQWERERVCVSLDLYVCIWEQLKSMRKERASSQLICFVQNIRIRILLEWIENGSIWIRLKGNGIVINIGKPCQTNSRDI